MKVYRAIARIFGIRVLSRAIGFLGLMYFARRLGASELGIFFLFQALVSFLAIPVDFGIRKAVEKRLSEGFDKNGVFSTSLLMKIAPLSFITILIIFSKNHINDYLGAELALLLIVVLLLNDVSSLVIGVLYGQRQVGQTAGIQLVRGSFWVVVGVLLLEAGFGFVSLIYGLIVGYSVTFVWGFYKSSVRPRGPSFQYVSSLLDFSKYSLVTSVGYYSYSWMDVLIIGLFLTEAHVGAYEVSFKITEAVMILSRTVSTTLFPEFSALDANEKKKQLENLIPGATTLAVFLVIPAFFGTLVLSRDILELLFGAEFGLAWIAFILLMGENILQSFQAIIGQSLQAIDRPELAAKAVIAFIPLNIILNLILIPNFGLPGAAAATLISFFVNFLLHYRYLSWHLDFQLPHRESLVCVLASTIMAAAVFASKVTFGIESVPSLIGHIALGVVIYAGFTFLSSDVRKRASAYV